MINKREILDIINSKIILFDQDYSDEIKDEICFVYYLFTESLKDGYLYISTEIKNEETKTFYRQNNFEVTDKENNYTDFKLLINS